MIALTPEQLQKIERKFTYHPPKPGQPERYQTIREVVKTAALIIEAECPEGREKSLAMTNLENAVMWANAAIARNE